MRLLETLDAVQQKTFSYKGSRGVISLAFKSAVLWKKLFSLLAAVPTCAPLPSVPLPLVQPRGSPSRRDARCEVSAARMASGRKAWVFGGGSLCFFASSPIHSASRPVPCKTRWPTGCLTVLPDPPSAHAAGLSGGLADQGHQALLPKTWALCSDSCKFKASLH